MSNYKISHGIAIIYGMQLIFESPLKERLNNILKHFDIEKMSFDKDNLYPYLLQDKKNKNNNINFVYLKDIGKVLIDGKEYEYGK